MRTPVVFALLLCCIAAQAQETKLRLAVSYRFDELIAEYGRLTGKQVESVRGLWGPDVTIRRDEGVPSDVTAKIIEDELAKNNIGLFPFASNRVVATWIDLSSRPTNTTPSASIVERLRVRREVLERMRNNAINSTGATVSAPSPSGMTSEDRMKRLRDYNLELIRSKGAKGPVLPIELTPEEDARLVAEGVLPPATHAASSTVSSETNVVIEEKNKSR